MSTSNDSPSMNLQLPLTLLAAAAAVFLGAQIGAVNRGGATMRWQLTNFDKQIASLKDAKKQFAEAITKREEQVKQSGQVQAQYTALLNEVLDLAKTDEDAKKLVQKWGIQRQEPPAGTKTDASKTEAAKPDAAKADAKPAAAPAAPGAK